MAPDTPFTCFLVEKDEQGQVRRSVRTRKVADLPPGEVLVRVAFSSLNYKDALAAGAHPGVVRQLPHVPGIDAAGTVVESSDARHRPGDPVVITGYELGAGQWGGWAEFVRVPADWIVPLPTGLSLRETMILGTAGFTAAQSIHAIQLNGVEPNAGEIVVTGATGGVGCLAVQILAKLGYTVVAVTGKRDLEPRLKAWGAARVIGRSDVIADKSKPLLAGRWAGAVDTVGGDTLATLVRETKNYGVVAACGLVGGIDLALTVHPFILRGVTLAGIGSGALPYDRRMEIWRKLAGPWRVGGMESLATTLGLFELEYGVQQILLGDGVGRTVVDIERAGIVAIDWELRMFELFEHTADLGLRIHAAELDELLAEAGRGLLTMLVANPEAVQPVQSRSIEIAAEEPTFLLFDWLSELLYAFESEKLLLAEFDVRVTDNHLQATCRGEAMDPSRHIMDHEVKAITYHALQCEQTEHGWEAEVIVDI